MTYDTDPTRWTKTPGAAPELLRDAFDAGHREGPSEMQMRSLALKLAALSGGAVLAATAAPAQAAAAQASTAAAGGAVATGGISFAKVAVSLALLGAAASAVVYRSAEPPPVAQHEELSSSRQARTPLVAPVVLPPAASRVESSAKSSPTGASVAAPVAKAARSDSSARDSFDVARQLELKPQSEPAARWNDRQLADVPRAESARERRRQRGDQRSKAAAAHVTSHVEEPRQASSDSVADEGASANEIDLLRSARANLTSRPREAYRLAELHRREFPKGVFVQERDALAIEALLRAGELKEARALAEKFIEHYPGSPHAHRFRESMEIP